MTIKVLAIDDDPSMTDLLTLLLKPNGFNVLVANSGEDGVRVTRERYPDVIVLDLMMPGMDGWKVCETIRTFSQVPILILSALDSPDTVASALDAGADDYLVKPVASGVLIARINTLARRAEQNGKVNLKGEALPTTV